MLKRSMRQVILSLCCVMVLGWLAASPAQAEAPVDVVVFTQAHCPPCLAAMDYFEKQGIAYRYFDIEASAKARNVFERLDGRGTPLILVNGKRLQAFSPERFDALYRQAEADRSR